MNGNKPLDGMPGKFAAWSPFTTRLAAHPKVAYLPYPDEALLVTMVVDEILVGERAAADAEVQAELVAQGAVAAGFVFDRENAPGGHNVGIWRLERTPGEGEHADVALAVWAVRQVLATKGIGLEQVAPNHVLIPAANYHSCPWSPPKEPDADPRDLGAADGSVTVTVIDSGYQAGSPIASRVIVTPGTTWFAKQRSGYYKWVEEPADPLDQNNDGRLDALVGHANFVAGVVAQMCPRATIEVVSHSGAFVDSDNSDWPIATEASVARSLWNSRSSDVINVGFAFPTLPAISPGPDGALTDGPPSWALDVVLRWMLHDHGGQAIVAPAGNQDSTTPQYPAAFPNVIGVGSVGAAEERSSFSNHGPWVDCCTTGENVVSTFITGDRPWKTEDAEPPGYPNALTHPTKNFDSGWASWSGTSFAAPRIAGAIANLKARGATTPLAAWSDLSADQLSPLELEMGVLIRDLRV